MNIEVNLEKFVQTGMTAQRAADLVVRAMAMPIRGLTLHRPYNWAIHGRVSSVSFTPGPKRIENRPWHIPPELVGKSFVALHSSQKFDGKAVPYLQERGWYDPGPDYPAGVITGVAFLAREFGGCTKRRCSRCHSRQGRITVGSLADQADPFCMPNQVHWVLTGRVPLLRPVPCKPKCAQGLWNLPPDVRVQLLDSYVESLRALAGSLEPGPRLDGSAATPVGVP